MGCSPGTTIQTFLCVSVSLWEDGFALVVSWCHLGELGSPFQKFRERPLGPRVPVLYLPSSHNGFFTITVLVFLQPLSLLAFSKEISKSLICASS